jgi:hypothetical protein
MKYSNLRNKTVFDFTRDEKILKEVLSEGDYIDFIEDTETTIKESIEWNLPVRVSDLVCFSKITDNNELYQALKDEFFKDFRNEFRQIGDKYLYS